MTPEQHAVAYVTHIRDLARMKAVVSRTEALACLIDGIALALSLTQRRAAVLASDACGRMKRKRLRWADRAAGCRFKAAGLHAAAYAGYMVCAVVGSAARVVFP